MAAPASCRTARSTTRTCRPTRRRAKASRSGPSCGIRTDGSGRAMMTATTLAGTPRPEWLTFDCYGTLIQWDEGLLAAVGRILAKRGGDTVDPRTLIEVYDRHEHQLEQ